MRQELLVVAEDRERKTGLIAPILQLVSEQLKGLSVVLLVALIEQFKRQSTEFAESFKKSINRHFENLTEIRNLIKQVIISLLSIFPEILSNFDFQIVLCSFGSQALVETASDQSPKLNVSKNR